MVKKPGENTSWGAKLKSLFLVTDQNTKDELAKNLQKTKLDEILEVYDEQNSYVDNAIATNAPDFDPAVDISRLRSLGQEVEAARQEAETFWQRGLKRLMILFPALLMLLPEDSELRKHIEAFLRGIQLGDGQPSFSVQAQQLIDQVNQKAAGLKDPDHTEAQIQEFLVKHQQKQQLVGEALRSSLDAYQEAIKQLVQARKNHPRQQLKTPEEYTEQVNDLIKNYEGRQVKNTDTPATDRFSATILLDNVQKYKAWYEGEMKKYTQVDEQMVEKLGILNNEYFQIVAGAHEYLINQQTALRKNYQKTTTEKTLSFVDMATLYKNTVNTVNALQNEFFRCINPSKTELIQVMQIDLKGKSELEKPFSPVAILLLSTIEKIGPWTQLDEHIAKSREEAITALKESYEQAFKEYMASRSTNNLQRLRALQDVITKKYQEFIELTGEYQELEYNLTSSGHKLAYTDTLRSRPHKPQLPFDEHELGWTAEELQEIYDGFAKQLGLQGLHIQDGIGVKVMNQQEAEEIQRSLRENLFYRAIDYNTTEPAEQIVGAKRYKYLPGITTDNFEITSAEAYQRLLQYRKDFAKAIRKIEHPQGAEYIVKLGDEMIKSGEFVRGMQADLPVGRFELPGFSGGFATSDLLKATPDPKTGVVGHFYNHVLAPTSVDQLSLKALKGDNPSDRGELFKGVSLQNLKGQGICYDEGENVKQAIVALMKSKGLSESDALALFMYLTGWYGDYRTGKYTGEQHGYLWLSETYRQFQTYSGVISSASLLFTVKKAPVSVEKKKFGNEKKDTLVIEKVEDPLDKKRLDLYLRNAPDEAGKFFRSLQKEEQLHIMKHVEYLPGAIRFLDANGKEICVMDDDDLEVPENELKKRKRKIKKEDGKTLFTRDAMMEYTKENDIQVPTHELYERMLQVMPDQHRTKDGTNRMTVWQLYKLLGGNSTYVDYFRTSSQINEYDAYALCVSPSKRGGSGYGQIGHSLQDSLLPVRALKKYTRTHSTDEGDML